MILKPRQFAKPSRGHQLSKGLVGYWLMNEGSGTKVYDLSGNGNTGSLVGNTHFVPGKFGSALDFDGTVDYVNLGGAILTTYPMTMICWFETDVRSDDTLFVLKHDSANSFYLMTDADGDVRLRVEAVNVIDYALTGVFTLNEWHMAAGVLTSATHRRAYLDGKGGGVRTGDLTPIGINGTRIGGNSHTSAWDYNGRISHVMLYNRALLASEVALLYREPFCIFERDPIELWSAATLGAGEPPAGIPILRRRREAC